VRATGLCAHLVERPFQVDDSVATTAKLAAAGAEVVAEPTRTPWNSLNSRLEAPGALQLTLFTELGD
jgi:hypothetical protein